MNRHMINYLKKHSIITYTVHHIVKQKVVVLNKKIFLERREQELKKQ